MVDTSNGVTGALQTTLPIAMTIAAFSAIAWYNVIDLNVLIWFTFKRRKGLYFYSLLISSWGIFVYQLAFLMKFFQVWKNNYVSVSLITIGWYCMVTGQSLVLYSRLHLIVRDNRKIRWVLYMICIDVVLFHFPTTVLTFGSNSNKASDFALAYTIMEKIQVTAFCIQEFIISGLYLYETRRILKPAEMFQRKRTRRVMLHLVYVNILIITMDIILLCTEYMNHYEIQITFKGALYSVKLRLEFAILNQLMALAKGQISGTSNDGPNTIYSNSHDHHLETFDATRSHHGGVAAQNAHRNSIAPKSYSFFAGKGMSSPFSHKLDNNCVVKTTEVVVNSSERSLGGDTDVEIGQKESSGDDISSHDNHNGPMSPQGAKTRPTRSPASSEVEFAGHGY